MNAKRVLLGVFLATAMLAVIGGVAYTQTGAAAASPRRPTQPKSRPPQPKMGIMLSGAVSLRRSWPR